MRSIGARLGALRDFVLSYWLPDYEYDYWHFPHRCSPRLSAGDYLIDFRPKTEYPGALDASGIPLLDLSSQHWSRSRDVVYSPIVVAQFGLGWYSRYLHGEAPAKARFITVAQWLRDHARRGTHQGRPTATLPTNYGEGEVLSAMAQGLAISLWCRALRETGDREYFARSMEAFRLLTIPIEQGGVVDDAGGIPVLQEWTNERVHILNGHLFAFIGILDLLKASEGLPERAEMQRAYDQHLDASVKLVRRTDLGFWTRYSLRASVVPNIASYFYHDLHIEMLKGLRELTGNSAFDEYGRRWQRQQRNPVFRALAMVLKLGDRAEVELRRIAGGTPSVPPRQSQ